MKRTLKMLNLLLIDFCFGVFDLKNRTSNTIICNMSKELFIPPVASFCVKAMRSII